MFRDQRFYDHHDFYIDFDHSPLVGRLLLLEGVPAQVQAASGDHSDHVLDDNDNDSSK